ncbi:DUF1963 domain-containing protein [Staphylococcus chromogenes]|nr:DUF1963 domain-containing protein [Staphylococcus chromogenes]
MNIPTRPHIDFDIPRSPSRAAKLAETKIGGAPFRPVGLPWPEFEGEPAQFVLQINLAEVAAFCLDNFIPELLPGLPERGLLQVFGRMHYSDQYVVEYVPNLDVPHQPPVQAVNGGRRGDETIFLPEDDTLNRQWETLVLEYPLYPLPMRISASSRLPMQPHPWDHEVPAKLRDSYENDDSLIHGGHRLGGCASLWNEDPRPVDKLDRLLLQFGSEGPLLPANDALIRLYIAEEDLRAGKFDKVWCYEDRD